MLTGESFQKVLPEHCRFSIPGWYVWGSTIVKGEDRKFHMIFSMWEEKYGFDAWMQHSKLGYAVADFATGPYQFVKIIAEGRGGDFWDAVNVHNECMIYEDGHYYLYYTGAKGNGEFWDNRNHQRAGVMVAKHPAGPWKRFDKPLIDVKNGNLTTGDPVVSKMKDGKFLMVYKTVLPGKMPFGGGVVHKVAIAEHPLGPFVDQEEPFIELPNADFPIDDHTEWLEDNVYYAIVKDNQNKILKRGTGSVLFQSDDGIHWKMAENPFLLGLSLEWDHGIENYSRLEMPKIVWDGDRIAAVAFAARPEDAQKLSYNIQIPVQSK